MAARKAGLGRGLEALIPAERPEHGFTMVALGAIDPSPQQPRARFDDEALEGLAASIREVGVLQPVVVRPSEDGRYLLVAGERRWRAARIAGLTEIPAVIRAGDDAASLTEAVIENVQREDLTPLEEAAAYRQLLEDFGLTHEQIGERVGKSRSAITNTLRLLLLPPPIQAMLASRALTAGHCRPLVGLDDTAYAEHIARRAADEGWPVRRVEDAVRARAGDTDATPGAKRDRRPRPPEILALEERLGDRLGSPVRIDYGRRGGGRLVVRFSSVDELERIYRSLSG
jgi:ParB family chromosome partitioning protein